jgi:tetratricopeptide (TPR) repeat protein
MTTQPKPLSPDKIRLYYRRYGLQIVVDNTRGDRRSADELFRAADEIDNTDPTKAEKLYKACLRKNPQHSLAWCNLGIIYYLRDDVETALLHWHTALSHNPKCAEANYNIGYMYLSDDANAGQAIRYFKLAVTQDPTLADAWFNLAMAHSLLKQYAAARRGWERYLELEPNGNWAQLARGYIDGVMEKLKGKES